MRAFVSIGIVVALALSPGTAHAQNFRAGGHPTMLDLFPSDHMRCGRTQWKVSPLLGSSIPFYACVLQYKSSRLTPFGPL